MPLARRRPGVRIATLPSFITDDALQITVNDETQVHSEDGYGHSAHLRRKQGPVQSRSRQRGLHRRTGPYAARGAFLRRRPYLHHAEHSAQRPAAPAGDRRTGRELPHTDSQPRHPRSHRLRGPLSAHERALPRNSGGISGSKAGMFYRDGLRNAADADRLVPPGPVGPGARHAPQDYASALPETKSEGCLRDPSLPEILNNQVFSVS
jgi:hypothetical protein